MALALRDCTFFGSALSESFALNDLEAVLAKEKLLDKPSGPARREIEDGWESYRRKLRALGDQGGTLRVRHHVLDPLAERLGYGPPQAAGPVQTREDEEDGGFLYAAASGAKVRAWAVDLGTDLDAPNQRGRAYRFSPARVAERVLLAAGERVGLLTDGEELRVVIVDPARPGSHVAIALGRSGGWRGTAAVPDSYRLVRALASPAGLAKIGAITEAARLAQTRVTKSLRDQARRAVEVFVQALLDNPANSAVLEEWVDREALSRTLWREGLVVVYRLLFILKLEASADPARAFSFASTSLWRNTYSPNVALAPVVKDVVERGAESGSFLGDSLRATFRLFSEGLASSELKVSPLGGMLFGAESAPLVSRLAWTEQGVAALLDNLLWTRERGQNARARVHYGSLDVEDLGRVYEALLELEPGIADRPMCRLRRAKLEVVVEAAKGAPYRAAARPEADEAEEDDADEDSGDDEAPKRGKAKAVWVEEVAQGRFFLRVGLGRKATGSYYTPHPFVRFLVQETVGPQVSARSPADNPKPGEILKLKVLDPAMGSGHFLVEACRFLGEKLYEATRLCDGLAADAGRAAAAAKDAAERERLLGRARELRQRVEELPDPNDELVAYLPSRAAEGGESGLSQSRALAICRRLVAVHCLYGVDKNPLAVELAKVSLWLESYAEGLPLTFLDHRLVCGDSLTAPFFRHLMTDPVTGKPLEGLFLQRLGSRLKATLAGAVQHVRDLEASVGKDAADLERKRVAKARLDEALAPFRTLSEVWSGLAKLGSGAADPAGWEVLLTAVADGGAAEGVVEARPSLRTARAEGQGCAAYEFLFPEVFFPGGNPGTYGGFDGVVGNPPWDKVLPYAREFGAAYDVAVLDAPTKTERDTILKRVLEAPHVAKAFSEYKNGFQRLESVAARMYAHQRCDVEGAATTEKNDLYRLFVERGVALLCSSGALGLVTPAGLHSGEGATGLRRLLLDGCDLKCLFGFTNARRLFDIGAQERFDLVVAGAASRKDGSVRAGFRLTDPADIGGLGFRLKHDLIRKLGGPHLVVLEVSSAQEAQLLATAASHATRWAEFAAHHSISTGDELNATHDAHRLVRAGEPDALVVHEGKTIGPFSTVWTTPPRFAVVPQRLADRAYILTRARFYRLAFRRLVGFTQEKCVAALLPPGCTATNTCKVEWTPQKRANTFALLAVAVGNSLCFNWLARLRIDKDFNGYLLNEIPVPDLPNAAVSAVIHGAARLVANEKAFAPLWREQFGSEWREPNGKAPRFPVLETDEARWAARASIDAVVAEAYGLDRAQYEHVLASFSHKSYPAAPALCLEAYDELKHLGLIRFCKKHDPYFDIPLVETLPVPAIDLPGPAEAPVPLGSAGPKGRAKKVAAGQLALGEFQMAAEPVAGSKRKRSGKKAR